MDIYLESNYVLELALLQEQVKSCERIIDLADDRYIRLVIPAYCLAEPYEVQYRLRKRRTEFSEKLKGEFDQLSRSDSYRDKKDTFQQITEFLVTSQEEERVRLDEIILRLTDIGEVINLTREIVTESIIFQQDLDLSPQDSFVFASIHNHLKKSGTEESCFISRNSKDFSNPDIVDELEKKKCKILFNFEDGLGFIESKVEAG